MKLELSLENPIDFIGMQLVKVWFNVTYPTGHCTWALQNEDGVSPIVSAFHFPQDVLDSWTDSDDVLFNYLKDLKPWEQIIKQHEQEQGQNNLAG